MDLLDLGAKESIKKLLLHSCVLYQMIKGMFSASYCIVVLHKKYLHNYVSYKTTCIILNMFFRNIYISNIVLYCIVFSQNMIRLYMFRTSESLVNEMLQ